eukprot:TRINITY_DN8736_c0_g1_i1.p1 TRINITY_DN8736_c0_g1~~TRINITY_DN8736_c0_g1_i1.p1  ORF type:complete len:281 (+),score=113.59 TRINITY_DN8736_c0_g1_i1:96-938(+)
MGNQVAVCAGPAVDAGVTDAPEIQQVTNEKPGEIPMWKLEADSMALRMAESQKLQAEEAARKAEEEAAQKAKEEEEAAAKAEADKKAAEEAAAKAEAQKKKASAKKTTKKAAPAPAPKKEAPKEEEKPAAPDKLDRQAIKDREAAFKQKDKKEQDDLGRKIRGAAKDGNTNEVKDLLEKGCIPDLPDKDGWVPLMEAAQAGHADCCSALLYYGADPKKTIALGEWGMTALHYAARNGHTEVARVLAPVSDVKIKNFQSKTAAEVAKAAGHSEVAKICKGK